LGNQTHKDHFKLLQMDGSSLLIGARNVIYNLSINDLSENVEQVGPFVSLIISSFYD
jgi:semaphorin 6